jgi:hypothetical protein
MCYIIETLLKYRYGDIVVFSLFTRTYRYRTGIIESKYLIFSSFYSYKVLTRRWDHWSQYITSDNPRGYVNAQMQRLADAPTLEKKRAVELDILGKRKSREKTLLEPIDDEYGMDCINAMIEDVNDMYAEMMAEGEE